MKLSIGWQGPVLMVSLALALTGCTPAPTIQPAPGLPNGYTDALTGVAYRVVENSKSAKPCTAKTFCLVVDLYPYRNCTHGVTVYAAVYDAHDVLVDTADAGRVNSMMSGEKARISLSVADTNLGTVMKVAGIDCAD